MPDPAVLLLKMLLSIDPTPVESATIPMTPHMTPRWRFGNCYHLYSVLKAPLILLQAE